MRLELTTAQAAAVTPHLKSGMTLLAKIEREGFDGSNPQVSGRLILELGNVPTASLPALRAAIRSATAPAPTKKRKAESK